MPDKSENQTQDKKSISCSICLFDLEEPENSKRPARVFIKNLNQLSHIPATDDLKFVDLVQLKHERTDNLTVRQQYYDTQMVPKGLRRTISSPFLMERPVNQTLIIVKEGYDQKAVRELIEKKRVQSYPNIKLVVANDDYTKMEICEPSDNNKPLCVVAGTDVTENFRLLSRHIADMSIAQSKSMTYDQYLEANKVSETEAKAKLTTAGVPDSRKQIFQKVLNTFRFGRGIAIKDKKPKDQFGKKN